MAIKSMLSEGMTAVKELETNIGRLVHLGMAILFVHHFMSHLCDLHKTAKLRRAVKINGEYAKDLKLMLELSKTAHKGISLNSIAFCRPTHVHRLDSCKAGLRGYSAKGFAWRWYIPEPLKFRASNNLLEHLAAIISPWINIIEGHLKPQDCVLLMTDSTMAEGQFQKSNFSKLGESKLQSLVQIKAAKKKANLFMLLRLKSYSQWFKGERNEVADTLSRGNDRSDEDLTNIFVLFANLRFQITSKFYPFPKKLPHG
jgi:hypothetical protein